MHNNQDDLQTDSDDDDYVEGEEGCGDMDEEEGYDDMNDEEGCDDMVRRVVMTDNGHNQHTVKLVTILLRSFGST